jgi:ribokinase
VITVVGSVNLDITVGVDRHPRRGETVLANRLETGHGGKGANQAVAAARLGAEVAFVGAVGRDAAGNELVSHLGQEGIDVSAVSVVGESSGTALVTVDETGENTIVVASGANWFVEIGEAARSRIGASSVVLSQLEIPFDIVEEVGRATSGTFILNAAPPARLPQSLLETVDILIVNQHEAMALAGSLEPAALRDIGVPTVVATLGAEGAQVVTAGDVGYVPAPPVRPVDTTGAGDAFCGAFAVAMDEGRDVFEAAALGAAAGALATRRVGARLGLPDRAALDAALARRP